MKNRLNGPGIWRISPKPPPKRSAKRWPEKREDYLVKIHLDDVTRSDPKLAKLMTQRFDRLFTDCSIRGKLYKLRNEENPRIPRYRPET